MQIRQSIPFMSMCAMHLCVLWAKDSTERRHDRAMIHQLLCYVRLRLLGSKVQVTGVNWFNKKLMSLQPFQQLLHLIVSMQCFHFNFISILCPSELTCLVHNRFKISIREKKSSSKFLLMLSMYKR